MWIGSIFRCVSGVWDDCHWHSHWISNAWLLKPCASGVLFLGALLLELLLQQLVLSLSSCVLLLLFLLLLLVLVLPPSVLTGNASRSVSLDS